MKQRFSFIILLICLVLMTGCKVNHVKETMQDENVEQNVNLQNDYNEYKKNETDFTVKFDKDGNLWIRRWVSECIELIYDYTILYVDGKIDSYITDFEKVGSASYDFHWMKNGNKIDESEFRQIENQFNNMTDQYSNIY